MKLGTKGMIEFMNFFSDGNGGYTKGKTPRPEGMVENIIANFRESLNDNEEFPAVQPPAVPAHEPAEAV